MALGCTAHALQLGFRNRRQEKEPEEEDNDQGEEIETSQKIKTYKDANMYLEEVQEFLEQEGHVEEAFKYRQGFIFTTV